MKSAAATLAAAFPAVAPFHPAIASVGTSQPAKEPAEVSDQVEETESATAAALKVCWKPYDAGWPAITHEVSSITSEQA